ncbi:MAG: molybdopterin molybdotransferase MoeA [Myxococcales bacterium]|nr:molybdopterin molybdotransferase MoeA [Myxococcales bacterium]
MKSIREALDLMMPAFTPVGVERVALADAVGRVLAEDVLGRSDLPPFSNSAMDGYAVRAADVASATAEAPAELPVRGESKAGGETPPALEPGCAMRIFTGAAMPAGADAVVMQENTRAEGEALFVLQAARVGENVRAQGSDLAQGAVMLARGCRLQGGELGILAAQRYASVTAYRRPMVAILCTGDELRDVSEPEAPGTIVNSNAYALAAQVAEAGGVPWVLPNVPDDLEVTVARLQDALRADLVITVGGVSVGEYDYVKAAFERTGVEASFWKVQVKPGKPLTFGRAGATPVVGLPGNPISAMVTFEAFVRPGLRAMQGDLRPHRLRHAVALAGPHRHSPGRPELARARVRRDGEGQLVAELLKLQGSGSLPSMVGVDALVMLPMGQKDFAAGEILQAVLLQDQTGAAEPAF